MPDSVSDPALRVPERVRTAAAWSWRLLIIGAAAYAALWLIGQLSVVLLPIAIALLITRALEPIASRMRDQGVPDALAAALTVIAALAVVVGALWFIAPAVADEFAELGPTVAAAVSDLEDWIVDDAPVDISRDDLDEARDWMVERGGELLRSSGGALTSGAFILASIAVGGVLAIFLTFFMVKDGARALSWGRQQLRPRHRNAVDRVFRRAWRTLGGYLGGSAILGTVEGLSIGLTVWLVGGTLVLPIMVLTFAAAFVPLVGAVAAGALAVLVTLVTAGTTEAIIVLVVAVLVQQFDSDLLAPIVFGRALELHPAIILVTITAGGSLFGFAGVLLAVPVTAIVLNGIAELRDPSESSDDDPSHHGEGDEDDEDGDGDGDSASAVSRTASSSP